MATEPSLTILPESLDRRDAKRVMAVLTENSSYARVGTASLANVGILRGGGRRRGPQHPGREMRVEQQRAPKGLTIKQGHVSSVVEDTLPDAVMQLAQLIGGHARAHLNVISRCFDV